MEYPEFSKGWACANSSFTKVGSMKCCTCGGSIEGDYQYRQKSKSHDWYYQAQHRACAKNIKDWEKLDKYRSFKAECEKLAAQITKEFKGDEHDEATIFCLLFKGYEIRKPSG